MSAHLELNVVLSEHAHFHHVPTYVEIVRRAHRAELTGASVFRGTQGFGHTHRLHKMHAFELQAHTPVVVVIVDTEARIREFLPQVQAVCDDEAVVSVHEVHVLSRAIGRR